ncbi:glycosyltransferase family 39 protein, partial [Candidatus Gottesmanbacteria bacterium]|nr:glycosyltransferase family 39 protein [Candidatus Gottesmanbacteria bacterium]
MNILKPWLILALIVIVAAFLRFYKLGQVPFGFYQDESAIGYNAYSILSTGKDEYGLRYPLYFKSFGDYKLPMYIYLTALSERFFGIHEWAVRLPSALFGTLTVFVLYLFVLELTGKRTLSFVASAVLTFNPWHIHYSRATFEVTVVLFFFVLGAYLLSLSFVRKKTGAFFIGTLAFIVAAYSYNLTRLLAPLLYAFILWNYFPRIRVIRRGELWTTLFVSLLLLVPFLWTLKSSGGALSARGTFILTSAAVQAPLVEFRSYLISLPPILTKLLFNQFVLTFWQYMQNILSYFSVEFYFLTGSPHGNHGIGNVGEFYVFDLPFMVIGLYTFWKEKSRLLKIMVWWVVLTIAVAALTREAPHATRSFSLIVPGVLLSAEGILTSVSWLKGLRNKTVQNISLILAVCFIAFNLVYYFTSYYMRFPILYAPAWRSSDKDLSLYLERVAPQYDHIIIDSNSGFIYTSLLFYQKYSPLSFEQSV